MHYCAIISRKIWFINGFSIERSVLSHTFVLFHFSIGLLAFVHIFAHIIRIHNILLLLGIRLIIKRSSLYIRLAFELIKLSNAMEKKAARNTNNNDSTDRKKYPIRFRSNGKNRHTSTIFV